MPPSPGTLCSLGLLMADTKFDFVCSNIMNAEKENIPQVKEIFKGLAEDGRKMLLKEGIPEDRHSYEWAIDMRYGRQNYEITVPLRACDMNEEVLAAAIEDFHAAHKKAYGYRNDGAPVKFVSYRVAAVGLIDKPELKERKTDENAPAPVPFTYRDVLFQGEEDYIRCGIYHRDDFIPGTRLHGPAIIEQMDCTTVLPPRWEMTVDGYSNMIAVFDEEDGNE